MRVFLTIMQMLYILYWIHKEYRWQTTLIAWCYFLVNVKDTEPLSCRNKVNFEDTFKLRQSNKILNSNQSFSSMWWFQISPIISLWLQQNPKTLYFVYWVPYSQKTKVSLLKEMPLYTKFFKIKEKIEVHV